MFVYAVTSYTNPAQTLRLVSRLRRSSPASRIVVSHKRKMPPPSASALASHGAELWLTSEPIWWGDASFLKSQLDVVRGVALKGGDWLTFLDGQDYPLRRVEDYGRHLERCHADALLEVPDDDPGLDVLLRRDAEVAGE